MKPRLRFWNGYWWCRRMGCTGQGLTPREAWDDMWLLYWEVVPPKKPKTWEEFYGRTPRAG